MMFPLCSANNYVTAFSFSFFISKTPLRGGAAGVVRRAAGHIRHLVLLRLQTIFIIAGTCDSQNVTFQKAKARRKHTLGEPIRGAQSRDTGNREDCGIITLFLFSSSPLIQPRRQRSPSRPVSIRLPFVLFRFLTPFPLATLEHLPSPSPGPSSHPVCVYRRVWSLSLSALYSPSTAFVRFHQQVTS